jgi:hypothetical protein
MTCINKQQSRSLPDLFRLCILSIKAVASQLLFTRISHQTSVLEFAERLVAVKHALDGHMQVDETIELPETAEVLKL